MTNRLVKTLLAVILALFSVPAWSLGLGDARVESFIGQPLSLHIELLTSPGDDLDSVTARLASAEDFALIGASRGAISAPLSFRIEESPQGASIHVTSRVSLNDPVLRLVVEVTWSSGRMLREYTVFLDPPTVPSQAPRAQTGRSPAPAPQVEQPAATDEPEEQVAEAAEATTSAAAPEAESEIALDTGESTEEATLDDSYGPIKRGETLWAIASNWVGDTGMDMSQVMLAIQRKNPDAFMRDNINLLKRGAQLNMPTEDEVQGISPARAHELVAQQEAAFRMRSSMAAATTPLIAADTGETLARSSPQAASAPEPLQEEIARLEIVPPSEADLSGEPGTGAVPGGEGSDEVARDLREELARTEEELFSERQQNTYLRERIAELEAQMGEQVPESEPGVSDTEFAQFQERLEAERLEEQAADEQMPEVDEEPEAPEEVPSVTTSAGTGDDTPWYNTGVARLIMIFIVVAAVAGWFYSRRRSDAEYVTDLGAMGEETGPAEEDAHEVLAAHGGKAEPSWRSDDTGLAKPSGEVARAAEEDDWGITFDDEGEEEEEIPEKETLSDDEVEVVSFENARRQRQDTDSEATILDESSSDPEIKLDLARAYISMGDKEAARVILNEVLTVGSEAQQEEARSMMDEL